MTASTMERIAVHLQTFAQHFHRGMDAVTGRLRNLGTQFKSFGGTMAIPLKTFKQLEQSMVENFSTGGRVAFRIRQLTHGMRGFRMELLGVMFFGMMLQRIFMSWLQPAFDLVGIFDLLNVTLGIVFLPIALQLLDILLPIMTWFIELPEPVKMLIGALAVFGLVIGTITMLVGSFMLGIGSLIIFAGPIIGFFAGAIGAALPFIPVILAIIGVIAALYLAWQTNFGGIRDIADTVWKGISTAVELAWTAIKGYIDILSEVVLGFFEGIFGEKVTWEDIWEAISTAVKNAWEVIGPTIEFMIETLKQLNEMLKPVIENLKPLARFTGERIGAGFRNPLNFLTAGLFGGLPLPIFGDMVWRPGASPIGISPDDTLIATKGGIGGGSETYNIDITINASNVDTDEIVRTVGDKIESELRMRSRA